MVPPIRLVLTIEVYVGINLNRMAARPAFNLQRTSFPRVVSRGLETACLVHRDSGSDDHNLYGSKG